MGVEPIGDGIYPPPAGFEDRDDHRTAIASAASKCHGLPESAVRWDQLQIRAAGSVASVANSHASLIYFGCLVVRR
jgi:hypothetical protein